MDTSRRAGRRPGARLCAPLILILAAACGEGVSGPSSGPDEPAAGPPAHVSSAHVVPAGGTATSGRHTVLGGVRVTLPVTSSSQSHRLQGRLMTLGR